MHGTSFRLLAWQTWAALVLLFLIFLTITYAHSKAWNHLNTGDQDRDLSLGLKIRHFEALSDGYHHPLLPALVAPFAEKRLTYFAKAKLINVAIGAAAFWVVAWVGLRAVGPAPTFLALIALCPGLSHKSAEFTAEPLLILLVTLTFYWLVRGFDSGEGWGIGGAFAALAYLTKGSGLLLPIAYVGSVVRITPRLLFKPRCLLFPVVFIAVASPLLLYNWQVFGSLFFNYNTAYVLWLDHTEEQMLMFDEGPPTMFSYLATHSPGNIVWRFLRGLVRVRGVEWVWPFLLIFLFLPKPRLAYFRAFPSKRTMFTVASTLVLTFYLPFSWSAVIQRGLRYLLPIFPIMFLFLADIVIFYALRLAAWLWREPTQQRLASLALTGLLVTLDGIWVVQLAQQDLPPPLAIDFEDPQVAAVYRLLDTPAFDGKTVLFGPSHDFTGTWIFRHHVTFPLIPPGIRAADFLPWLKRQGIDYILANKEMVKRRSTTVGAYLRYSPTVGVHVLRLAPGWEVVYRGALPTRFVLIRVR